MALSAGCLLRDADSLTKTGTRQLLADRLRYGKIKFTDDADYTAAKRKTKEECEKSQSSPWPRPTNLKPFLKKMLLVRDRGDSQGALQADPEVCGQAPALGAHALHDVPHRNFSCSTSTS